MSVSETDLMNQIRAIRDKRRVEGQEIVKAWLVREVLATYPNIHGADKDVYVLCANLKVGDLVRRVANEEKSESSADPDQKTFAGWEHLQRSYLVERENGPTDIKTEDMSDEELLAKADFFDKLSDSNRAHAQELRRYVAGRRAKKSTEPQVAA